MTHWSINPVGGPWLVALMALVLSLLLTVVPSGRPQPRMRRIWLLVLRAMTLLLLLLILLRPSRVLTETRRLPGSLVLLIDSSRSMQVADSLDNRSRWTVLRDLLQQAREPLAHLAKIWDLRFYRFDEWVTPVTWKDGRLDLPDLPEGDQSALGSAMEEILERESGQRIAALLLLSDGAQRALAPRDLAVQTATHLLVDENIPLYTFALGKPALGVQSDLRIGDLLVPDVAFSEAPLQVQAMVGIDGFSNQTFRVQLLWEQSDGSMQVVDTREVLASNNQTPVSFQYTPDQPGEYKVTVKIESPTGELVTTNNQQSTFVSVLKGGIQVLQLVGASRIGGGPGIESSFVRRALAAHADIQVHYQLLSYRQPRLNYRDRLRTGKYDVLMLSNLDAAALSKPSWQMMADQVATGAGFMMTGGLHSFGPGGYRNTPLERVLPFELGRAERQNFGDPPRTDMHLPGPLKMLPTTGSLGVHPILQVQDGLPQTLAAWRALPDLDGANRFPSNRLRSNAQVIAQSDRSPAAPLAITGAWGNGRTLALAIDSTWRWQMGGHGPLMRRFWRQVILWLAKKDDMQNQQVWIRLDQRRYQRGSRVRFTLGGPDQSPASERPLRVEIVRPDGSRQVLQSTKLAHSALGTNVWSGSTAETRQPGDYQIIVTSGEQQPDENSQQSHKKNSLPDTATVRFTVPNQDMELDQPAAEPTLLASLARQTPGGRGLAPEEFSALLKQLPSRREDFEESIVTQVTLWDRWPVLLTLVGLLSIEWWLRKLWGLV